jgi:sortase (surface protein transpeptidase)|tara:strand:- start:663 stop:992 length:330 start_codon:yes stop_codon:yes gene_type:complete
MKLRLIITLLIIALIMSSVIITVSFILNSKNVEISNQYENLQKYKNELEKINQYNKEILKNLENQIKNSDDDNISRINDEINIINQVINENKLEFEQIIIKLSQIKSNP